MNQASDILNRFTLGPPDTVESLRKLISDERERHDDDEGKLLAELYAIHGWPPALIKAHTDCFEYTAWIDGIGAVEFEAVLLLPHGWVHLVGPKPCDVSGSDPRIANRWQRGLDVRVSAIKWVADGGH